MWGFVAVGILLRLVHYLHACSLSVDESLLTLNVLDHSWTELFQPLDGSQAAPLGFLLSLKAAVALLGESERSLRLLALLSGVASLFLFRSLALRCLTARAVSIAVGLFALAGQLIFYSAQVKQYSSDVLIALILLHLADRVRVHGPKWQLMTLFGLVGAAALLSSHPALFVLGGIGLSMGYFDLLRASTPQRFNILIAAGIWSAAALIVYLLSLRDLSGHEWLLNFWQDEFMPLPPTSMDDVKWFITAFFQIFSKTLGFSLQGIGVLTVLVGIHGLWRKDRRLLVMLLLPLLLALLASGLQMYPFCCRLLLFAAPALLLLMAQGAVRILGATKAHAMIGVTLVALMFLHPTMWAGFHVVNPRYEEEVRPTLELLAEKRREGDSIYVYYGARPAFTYYSRRLGWDVEECCTIGVRSRKVWDVYREDLERFRGRPRVWFVFSHIYDWKHVDERILFLQYLDDMGTRVEELETHGAAVYLYDLERPGLER